MKIFLYSSPYQYYADNLIPLAKHLKELGHDVCGSYRLSESGEEYDMLTGKKVIDSYKRIYNEKFDMVYLTQNWWYEDLNIAKYCFKNKIKLLILEHATPMIRYTAKDGTKSHMYRNQNKVANGYFSFGKKNLDIMKEIGYQGLNIAVGSPRIDEMYHYCKDKEVREGTIIFDTSNKMEDQTSFELVQRYVAKHPNKKFIVKKHSRSPGVFDDLVVRGNISIHKGDERDAYLYENFIFSFPSSAMILPALLGRNINSAYTQHFCKEAKIFHEKYKHCFPEIGKESDYNYNSFIDDYLVFDEEEPTVKRIVELSIKS